MADFDFIERVSDGSTKAIGVESRLWADGHTNLVVSGNPELLAKIAIYSRR